MSKKVVIELTKLEADMLASVAGNGWGDGDYAEWLGGGHKASACARAMEKLDEAIRAAPQEGKEWPL